MARLAGITFLLLTITERCWATPDMDTSVHPASGWAEFAAGVHAEISDDTERALDYYRRAASNLSESARVAARLGFLELDQNNPQDAQRYFDRAAYLRPSDIELKAIAARSHELSGEIEKGIAYMEEVLSSNPLWARGYDILAKMYKKAGMWAGAVGSYSRLAQLPGMRALACERIGETYLDMARDHMERGDLAMHLFATRRALFWFDRTEEIVAGLPSVMKNRARCYAAMLRFRKAAEEYQRYLLIRPEDAPARRYLAFAQRSAGDYDAAIATLETIVKTTPEFLMIRFDLIETLIEADRLDRAAEMATETAARFPDNMAVNSLAGRCLVAVGDDERARKHLERALELDPRLKENRREMDAEARKALTEATLYLGLVHIHEGNDKTAMHFFGMTLELDPEDADANNNLGYLTLENGGDLRTALRLIARAVRIRPDCGEFLDSLGWVYFKLGRTPEAYEMLRDAAELVQSAEIHDHLGLVCDAMNRREEARKEWRRSLEIDPEYHPARLHLEESYRPGAGPVRDGLEKR